MASEPLVTPEMERLYEAVDNLRSAMEAVIVSGMPIQDVLALVQARMAFQPQNVQDAG